MALVLFILTVAHVVVGILPVAKRLTPVYLGLVSFILTVAHVVVGLYCRLQNV